MKHTTKYNERSDTHHEQRRGQPQSGGEDEAPQPIKTKQTEEPESYKNWHEAGEDDFYMEADAVKDIRTPKKVAMQTASIPKKKKKKKGGEDSMQAAPRRTARGGAGTKDMWTKFLGKRWNAFPTLSKKTKGSLFSRKGDATEETLHYDRYDPHGEYDDDSDEVSPDKIPVPCKFWAKGTCNKGDSCQFQHRPSAHPSSKLATHAEDEYNGFDNYAGVDDYPFMKFVMMGYGPPPVCLNWYFAGQCPNGDDCKLPHYLTDDFVDQQQETYEHEEDDTPVCSHWMQGCCSRGDHCTYKHSVTTTEDYTDPNEEWYTDAAAADARRGLFQVQQSAQRVAGAVASSIQQLRQKVNQLRSQLQADHQHVLTRTFQMCLGSLEDASRDTLLGLSPDTIGLTRFRSVLLKRSLKLAYDTSNLPSIESLCLWEAKLTPWLPAPPTDGSFSIFFEQHLCAHYLECLKAMAASPFCRCRVQWVELGSPTTPDTAAEAIRMWARYSTGLPPKEPLPSPSFGFTYDGGLVWTPELHHHWPLPFRGRTKALVFALKRNRASILPQLLPSILQYLPPVDVSDVPEEEAAPGIHPFLDLVSVVLINYVHDILSTSGDAKEKAGEAVWPLVVEAVGAEAAPKITGMLLQMKPLDLLLDAVNISRFVETVEEANAVLKGAQY